MFTYGIYYRRKIFISYKIRSWNKEPPHKKTENIYKIITFKLYSRCLLCQHSLTVTYYMQIAEIATDSFDGLRGKWQLDIILDCFISNVLTIDVWKCPSNCGSLQKNKPLGSIEEMVDCVRFSRKRRFQNK